MNKIKYLLLFTLLVTHFSLTAHEHLVVTHPYPKRGFFSVMNHVFGNLFLYYKEPLYHSQFSGFTVDFGDKGLYYDPTIGENWWSYYFEPMEIGDISGTPHYLDCLLNRVFDFGYIEHHASRETVYELIQNHLVIKRDIIDDVDTFAKKNFSNAFVVGIHYRGTDKVKREAPRVSYETVLEHLDKQLATISGPFKIFVATDEAPFLQYISQKFPDNVIYVEEIDRSWNRKPIHMNPQDRYSTGRYALIDCLLLSKCDSLIRTCSILSRWSTYFNPELPVLELSQRNPRNLAT